MGALNVSDKTLRKYFTFLNKLDDSSKTKLIDRLKKSLSNPGKNAPSISEIYGCWEEPISAEDQIKEIHNARIDRPSELNFE
ncbi:hypothetical protein [Ekhidna sp.]|uniref:hypothetical protein n=1 Tax=Ekhidna sp. TaxID=2608089 RepID=UPI003CCBB80C